MTIIIDEYHGVGGTYIIDKKTGKRVPVIENNDPVPQNRDPIPQNNAIAEIAEKTYIKEDKKPKGGLEDAEAN